MDSNEKYLLRISCITYNQSAYITDAMNGFAMQQTDFPFVAVIIDDASTDGEQGVIKSYIEEHFDHSEKTGYREWETEDAYLIFARHKVNENCHFVVALLKRNLFKEPEKKGAVVKEWMNAKYIALCEGDDYWTDPLKLQKQVDFLEGHPDFSLCFHKVKIWKEKEGIMVDDFLTREVPQETELCDLAEGNYIHTPSVVYRKDERIAGVQKRIGAVGVGDYVNWMICAQFGKMWKMEETMAVYRYGVGVWSTKNYANRLFSWCSVLDRIYVTLDDDNAKKAIEKQIKETKERLYLELKESCLINIQQSKEFRIGRFLLYPYRWLKRACCKL